MATIAGQVGVAWGLSATGISYTGSATVNSSGEDHTKEADSVEVKDNAGDVVGVYYYNYRDTLSLKCFPATADGSVATDATTPEIGSKVTLVAADGDIAGDWVATGVSKSRKTDGIVEFDLSLTKWANMTLD